MQETDGWFIVEEEHVRLKGFYGCRHHHYDDQEAEGNIYITDDDL